MATLVYLAVGAAALFFAYRWLVQHPAQAAVLPLVAGMIVAIGIFMGFLSLVRPVSQLETLIAMALGGGCGAWVWWKLRSMLRPWLQAQGVQQG
ncbi:hypothetical protein [Falsiroseomonas sp. HW251]|uniref:hypothetical protein n=1 Tax=Falsiroseomonas sp. HW251 TaxID=3390998 RepID=UPI003D31544F